MRSGADPKVRSRHATVRYRRMLRYVKLPLMAVLILRCQTS